MPKKGIQIPEVKAPNQTLKSKPNQPVILLDPTTKPFITKHTKKKATIKLIKLVIHTLLTTALNQI